MKEPLVMLSFEATPNRSGFYALNNKIYKCLCALFAFDKIFINAG